MTQTEIFGFVVETLKKLKINYMIVGSVASTVYGKPRLTYDMDILISIKEDQAGALAGSFDSDWYADAAMVREAAEKKMPFNFIHIPSGNKIDFFPAGVGEYEKAQFLNKTEQEFDEKRTAFFSSAEDVIIKKLDYYMDGESSKHIEDIKGILEVRGGKLNLKYIDYWAEKKGSLPIWKKIKEEGEK
ncbi:MAG: hypothetical protein CVU78_03325 [Elusimicrobia bacterium HGW-Elusimicrobia-2]|nr:MAG: hypothetical protein CVU78_03325 [Elusimicrobia bacterium HGW-Elusimicrobia-2]